MDSNRLANLRMLFNYRRLRNVRRTNNLPTLHMEDVAQHSFYVAILATTLAENYNAGVVRYNANFHPFDVDHIVDCVDVNRVTHQALFHDMEEAFTSDIPWNVKHHDNHIHTTLQRCIQEKLETVYNGTSGTIKSHKDIILNAKLGLAGKFVNVADAIEGAWYCYTEWDMGNRYIGGLFLKYLQVIRDDSFIQVLKLFGSLFSDIMEMFEAKEAEVRNAIQADNGQSCSTILLD